MPWSSHRVGKVLPYVWGSIIQTCYYSSPVGAGDMLVTENVDRFIRVERRSPGIVRMRQVRNREHLHKDRDKRALILTIRRRSSAYRTFSWKPHFDATSRCMPQSRVNIPYICDHTSEVCRKGYTVYQKVAQTLMQDLENVTDLELSAPDKRKTIITTHLRT